MSQPNQTGLVRAIGRWSLAALIVNSIIGSGIFGLPSVVAGLVGTASVWAVLAAGGAIGIIMACFAELASQFTQAGGPYLYARTAFGRLVGIETGWMFWLSQLAAPAANANLFVIYFGEFWPGAKAPVPRFLILTLLIGILTVINYRGVRAGTEVSNVFTIAKLVPLAIVIVGGAIYFFATHAGMSSASVVNTNDWPKAILLLLFAYGGFETALTPMSEAKDPRRDAVFGLFAALVTCTLVYTLIQWVVVGVSPDPAHSERPLADVVRLFLGSKGADLIAIGALVSVYGYLSAKILAVPRITYALAERGDFPRLFGAVHPRFHTPYFSILVFAVVAWLLAIFGSFAWNVTLSALARLFYYGIGCAALPVLRRKQPGAALFRLPGGNVFSGAGVVICLVLVTRVDRSGSLILLATILAALLNWAWVRNRKEIEIGVR
ncbi:MAG: APC family permease [Acidobacteriia bacterium]|nr:APC family permease [Terriglobia bacterium]